MIDAWSPARLTRALLFHTGSLRVNAEPGENVAPPAPLADLQSNVPAGSVPPAAVAPARPVAPYVPPDAGTIMAAGYDEVYVDVQPVVRPDGSVGAATPAALEAVRQVAATGRPYWFIVRVDGYGQPALNSRNAALQAALNVVSWCNELATNYMAADTLAGYAFLCPDLNVVYADNTVIDRLFQNTLVQACWEAGGACTIVTSRPADATALVGPTLPPLVTLPQIIANPNSGTALVWPLIGCSPAYTDRIAVLYPVAQLTGQSPGVVLGMTAGLMRLRGRDSGFPLNLTTALVSIVPEAGMASDGVVGTVPVASWYARVNAFAAALGITVFGVTSTGYVTPAGPLLPADAGVNTTGLVRAGSSGGTTRVEYPDLSGDTAGIVRAFADDFTELQAPA